MSAVCFALALSACAAPTSPTATATSARARQPLNLLATTPLLRDALENVTAGIHGVTVTSLVPLGGDPHEFEPTPKDVKTVAESSAIFANGAGLESAWLDKLLKNAGVQRPIVIASEGVKLNSVTQFGAVETDPHIWQDPIRWKAAVLNIAKGVAALDPAIAGQVNANAAAYNARLDALDAAIRNEVAQLSPERRVLVTTHDALGYFAERYGFKIVGAVIPSVSSAAEPSAKNMRDLVDKIRVNRVKAIFTEFGVNPKLTTAVANESGARVVEGLRVDTLSDRSGPAPTYIDMMRYNATLIVNALK